MRLIDQVHRENHGCVKNEGYEGLEKALKGFSRQGMEGGESGLRIRGAFRQPTPRHFPRQSIRPTQDERIPRLRQIASGVVACAKHNQYFTKFKSEPENRVAGVRPHPYFRGYPSHFAIY